MCIVLIPETNIYDEFVFFGYTIYKHIYIYKHVYISYICHQKICTAFFEASSSMSLFLGETNLSSNLSTGTCHQYRAMRLGHVAKEEGLIPSWKVSDRK